MGPLGKLRLKQELLTSVLWGSEDPFGPDESHWILSRMFICKNFATNFIDGWMEVTRCPCLHVWL